MTFTTLKRAAGLMCCTALLFTAAGCKKNNDTIRPAEKSASQTTAVTTKVTQPGVIGEKSELSDVEVTVSKLYRSEYFGSQEGVLSNVIFLDVTVTNNTDEDIDSNMLTSFEFEVDGEIHDAATLLAISSAKKQFGDDVNLFTETLEPGDSQTGCIPAELPRNFNEVTVYFMPLGGASESYDVSKAITYTFTKGDLEDIKKPGAVMETTVAAETAAE